MPKKRRQHRSASGRKHARSVTPHRPDSPLRQCRRCGHHWPCPSAVAGIDLPKEVPCNLHDPAPGMQAARVHLTALDLAQDTGRRDLIDGELHIRWALNPRIAPFIEEIGVDIDVHGTSPDEEDIRMVLRWLVDHQQVQATRGELALMCADDVPLPAAHIERCLFWAEVFGFVEGPV